MIEGIGTTITETAARIRSGLIAPTTLVEQYLARIDEQDPAIGAYVHVAHEAAMLQAEEATKLIGSGTYLGPLHGIPIGVKDLIDVAGMPTAANSNVRTKDPVSRSATSVARLERAGAIILGKTRTFEYGWGVVTPGANNPWDLDRTPGGSSGGSGAALAANLCIGALGTDTGGSIRTPAAFCGVAGLKPTFGLVPTTGVESLTWTLDHVGPMAQNVTDLEIMLRAMSGSEADRTTGSSAPLGAADPKDLRGLRVGIPDNFGRMDPALESALEASADVLRRAGAELRKVSLPNIEYFRGIVWTITMSENAAYHKNNLRDRGDLLGEDVRKFLQVGSMILATDYITALRMKQEVKIAWDALLGEVDFIIQPTIPFAAPRHDQENIEWSDGTEESVLDGVLRGIAASNLTGNPSLSLPAGMNAEQLPVGIQLIGRPFEDFQVLALGEILEGRI